MLMRALCNRHQTTKMPKFKSHFSLFNSFHSAYICMSHIVYYIIRQSSNVLFLYEQHIYVYVVYDTGRCTPPNVNLVLTRRLTKLLHGSSDHKTIFKNLHCSKTIWQSTTPNALTKQQNYNSCYTRSSGYLKDKSEQRRQRKKEIRPTIRTNYTGKQLQKKMYFVYKQLRILIFFGMRLVT